MVDIYDFYGRVMPVSKNTTTTYNSTQAVAGILTGSSLNDAITTTGADMTIIGGAGDDLYITTDSKDKIIENSNGGIDTVMVQDIIGRGKYYIMPENVENAVFQNYTITIIGNVLANYIKGTAAAQVMDGGKGDDVLTGGGGGDVFIFKKDTGHDLITDFHVTGTKDQLRIGDYKQFTTIDTVQAAMTQVGSDVILQLSATDAVKLLNVNKADLTDDHFQTNFAGTANMTQTFNDDFNTLSIWDERQGTWRTDYGWGGNRDALLARNLSGEKEVYIDPYMKGLGTTPIGITPFSIDEGILTIHAERTPDELKSALFGYNFTSGLISTRNSFVQTYGYFEASIEISGDKGTWPAFWLYSQDTNPTTGKKFEIDMLENWGSDSNQIAVSTVHTYDTSGVDHPVAFKTFQEDLTQGFHKYGVLWTAQTITWYIDGVEVGSVPTPADGHGPMYLIINMALDSTVPADFQSSEMKIDYVKAYSINEAAPAQYAALAETHSFTGTTGNDFFYVRNVNDTITENANSGNDMVQSAVNYTLGANLESLILVGIAIEGTGNGLNNNITGNAQNNILSGGAGNDYINGGLGADTMIGGLGTDSYIVDQVGDRIVELAGEGTDTVTSSVWYYGLADNVENLILATGSAAIYGVGNDLDNRITGNAGINTLMGGGGKDFLDGGTNYDTMQGGAGDDTYIVDHLWDRVLENANEGIDTVYTRVTDWDPSNSGKQEVGYTLRDNVENVTLQLGALNAYGNSGNNSMIGNEAKNILYGYGGNDTLIGGTGDDTMVGGTGDDWYDVDTIQDVVREFANEGWDTVNSKIDYVLPEFVEKLRLEGSALMGIGNSADNTIWGNGLANTIYGWDGNDIFVSGKGADTLKGGLGADSFVFKAADKDGTIDNILDFNKQEGDILNLSDFFSNHTAVQQNIDNFIKMTTSNGQTTLSINVSGTGTTFDAIAKFSGVTETVADLQTSGNLIV